MSWLIDLLPCLFLEKALKPFLLLIHMAAFDLVGLSVTWCSISPLAQEHLRNLAPMSSFRKS